MTRQQFLAGDYTHYMVVKSLDRSVNTWINTESIRVMAFKITKIDPEYGIDVIVLVTDQDKGKSHNGHPYYTLWKMFYTLKDEWQNWENHVIENSIIISSKNIEETSHFKKFLEESKSPEIASQKCKSEFFKTRTFEQKKIEELLVSKCGG